MISFNATINTQNFGSIGGQPIGASSTPATISIQPTPGGLTGSFDITIDTPPVMIFAGKPLGDTHTHATIVLTPDEEAQLDALIGGGSLSLANVSAQQLASQVPESVLFAAVSLLLMRPQTMGLVKG